MCTAKQYDRMKDFYDEGPWKSESALMSECLHSYPMNLIDLTKEDADTVIDYCTCMMPTRPEGKCVDLWKDEHEAKTLSSESLETTIEYVNFEQDVSMDGDNWVSMDGEVWSTLPSDKFLA